MSREPALPAEESRQRRPRPLHRYGQNHLVDGNVLAAILLQADVRPEDVVLEVGAADGTLTRPLLERARTVHAFEVDRRFAAGLESLSAERPGLRLHLADVMKARLDALDPAPTALVANLAYNIAIPLVLTTIETVPGLRRWAVMVQKELGERLFATPGTKAYAAVSVLTQLACEFEHSRAVPRSAFRPRPRVDSVFLTFVRRVPARDGSWRVGGQAVDASSLAAAARLARLTFAQRRKQMTTTLAGAAMAGRELTRDEIATALVSVGASPRARPEELSPARWVALAALLGGLAAP